MNSLKWIGASFVLFITFLITAVNLKWNIGWLGYLVRLPFGDKVAHFFLIGSLAFFVNILLDRRRIRLHSNSVLLGSFLVFIFITVEEASQFFLAHRDCDVLDLMANYLGIYWLGRLSIYAKGTLNKYQESIS